MSTSTGEPGPGAEPAGRPVDTGAVLALVLGFAVWPAGVVLAVAYSPLTQTTTGPDGSSFSFRTGALGLCRAL